MNSILNWFSPTKESVWRMQEKNNIQGLLRILTKSNNYELRNVAIQALNSIHDSKTLEKVITSLSRNHKAFDEIKSTALYRLGKNSGWGLDLLKTRESALALLGKTGIIACDSLKQAFDYASENSKNDYYIMEENYTWEVNAAIVVCGKSMIPFLKEKLSDNAPMKHIYFVSPKLRQADRAALLLKEIDAEAIRDPRALDGLLNVSRIGIPLKGMPYGYHGDREQGQLSACEGIVWLGKPELVIDIVVKLALQTWGQGGAVNIVPINSYEKAINLLGKIRTPQSFEALEKVFDFTCKKDLSEKDFTGDTMRYMRATDSAILSCGSPMIPFLRGKLSDSTIIYVGTPESFKENKVFAIKQSERARSLLSQLGVAIL